MHKAKWTAILITTGLLLIIILQNTDPVETRILFTSFVMPRAVLLFVTAVLGFLCGVAATLVGVRKRK